MSEVIEKVAKTICNISAGGFCEYPICPCQETADKEAKAAIQALIDADWPEYTPSDCFGRQIPFGYVEYEFNAMLQQLLQEGK